MVLGVRLKPAKRWWILGPWQSVPGGKGIRNGVPGDRLPQRRPARPGGSECLTDRPTSSFRWKLPPRSVLGPDPRRRTGTHGISCDPAFEGTT